MQRRFDNIIGGLLPRRETALLAVSGGIDSMCMAELFTDSPANGRFAVAHCNFHLRGEESNGDALLVRQWCDRHGIRLFKADFNTLQYASDKGLSIEMAARELRYNWFASICRDNGFDALSVAHNANDNAETLLLNLTRGTGLKGLIGMKEDGYIPIEEDKSKRIRMIRPLLSFARDEIERYIKTRGTEFHEDSTNANIEYKRNRIRHVVLPALLQLNPSCIETFSREMKTFAIEEAIAEEYFTEAVKDMEIKREHGGIEIPYRAIFALKHPEYVLFRLLSPYGFRNKALEPVLRLLSDVKPCPGKTIESPDYSLVTTSSGLKVRPRSERGVTHTMEIRSVGDYHIGDWRASITLADTSRLSLEDIRREAANGTIYVDADRLPFPFTVRNWAEGDWMRPIGCRGRKKLSDIFTDLKADIIEKAECLVFCSGESNLRVDCTTKTLSKVIGEALYKEPHTQKTEIQKSGGRALLLFGHASGSFFCRTDEIVKIDNLTRRVLRIDISLLQDNISQL